MKLRRIGEAASALAAITPQARRIGLHGAAIGGTAFGGAATGYLAADTTKGAAIGALFNVGLFGLTGALFGASGRLSTNERIFYGILGLGAGGAAGYLFWQRR